jgi:uncharacterized protein involved in exopolysaccharide biosynthesis
MTATDAARRHWRIPLVAVLGALIAFGGSFVLEETYASSTRLLIRGRESRFLTTTGQDLSTQPGVVDASLSKALAETYAGIATSRGVAVGVVDRLHLDAPRPERSGPIAAVTSALAWTYRCGRAYATHGFCADTSVREQAILDVQEGTVAAQLGSTSGESAGQPGSYILEIAGSGPSARQARAVTDALADELVRVSSERFHEDAQRFVDSLAAQVTAAEEELGRASEEVSRYKSDNGISAVDEELVLNATGRNAADDDRRRLAADIADTEAQLASVNSSLQANPGQQLRNELQSRRSQLQAQLDGLRAREKRIGADGGPASAAQLNEKQAGLAVRQQRLDLAKANHTELSRRHQGAVANAANDTVELTRIDEAAVPTYPIAPKRHLYLSLGALLGGLAGGGLTWLVAQREAAAGPDDGHRTDRSAVSAAAADSVGPAPPPPPAPVWAPAPLPPAAPKRTPPPGPVPPIPAPALTPPPWSPPPPPPTPVPATAVVTGPAPAEPAGAWWPGAADHGSPSGNGHAPGGTDDPYGPGPGPGPGPGAGDPRW